MHQTRFTLPQLPQSVPPIASPEHEPPVNCVAIKSSGETYVYLYDDEHIAAVKRAIGRQAACPELSLNWYDAARLNEQVNKQRDSK